MNIKKRHLSVAKPIVLLIARKQVVLMAKIKQFICHFLYEKQNDDVCTSVYVCIYVYRPYLDL